jgi:hypothetical protein
VTGFELAEIGRTGQRVDPLRGGDVSCETGRLLSIAELRAAVTFARRLQLAPPTATVNEPEAVGDPPAYTSPRVRWWQQRHTPDPIPDRTATGGVLSAVAATPPAHGGGDGTGVGLPSARLTPVGVHVVGVSGGCGESTVAGLLPAAAGTGHRWPIGHDPADANPRVLLVARTTMASLVCAQRAAGQWAAGDVPGVELLGLVLTADSPGGDPRPIADLVGLITGGLPRIWRLPWMRDWRLLPPDPASVPRPVAAVVRDITARYSSAAPIDPTSPTLTPAAEGATR